MAKETETKTAGNGVATEAQGLVKARALESGIEYGGLRFAKGAQFFLPADKAAALEGLVKVKIIGA